MKNSAIERLEAITPNTLVVGVDIAKETHGLENTCRTGWRR